MKQKITIKEKNGVFTLYNTGKIQDSGYTSYDEAEEAAEAAGYEVIGGIVVPVPENSDKQPIDDNELRDKSLKWWVNLGHEQAWKLRDKYFPTRPLLTADERLEIYLSEHKQPIVDGLPELLKKIYHEIDIHCLSETNHVTMDTVRNVLVKHGANEPDLW